MNRTIKFRGLRTDGKGWVVGYYVFDGIYNINSINDGKGSYYQVHPETVSQFTGLLDKNGVEIYEGDVIQVDCSGVAGAFEDGEYKVGYFLPDCAFCLESLKENKAISFNECYDYTVIGNIHEHKHLLV
jgi:uncharacterized phage protein (TIGR01671 family)